MLTAPPPGQFAPARDELNDELSQRYGFSIEIESNPANVLKTPQEAKIEKFGRSVIDGPSNLIWVPRLKHELIAAYCNSTMEGDAAGRIYRRVVNDMDYDAQRKAGLAALRFYGVLK